MNEADLVIVLATPLYGQSLRSHFGSKEELALIKLLHKPFFLIKACDKVPPLLQLRLASFVDVNLFSFMTGLYGYLFLLQISEPGVRDLEFRQPDHDR